jgi:hypothetical protein
MVASGSVTPGSDVYKRRPRALGFHFLASAVTPPTTMHEGRCPHPADARMVVVPWGARRWWPTEAEAATATSPRREPQRRLLLGASGDDGS